MRKSKFTSEEKLEIIQEYLNGKGSQQTIADSHGIDRSTFQTWMRNYEAQGEKGLLNRKSNASYTKEFKMYCVKAVLNGEGTTAQIAAKNNISDKSVLRNWVKRYNANMELKDYEPKREVYMAAARRKTTAEERKEIVKYCIAHGNDYKGTASLYDVSYDQVYNWVRKYKKKGEDGLLDKRGKRKPETELTEEEKLRREVKLLKKQLEERDMLVALLKKARELEGM